MTKVPLEEHLAHPLRSFMEELYHARKERHSVQTSGLYFVNEPCRYFLKFCPNIRRTPCLQIGGLPFPHTCLLYSAVCQPRPSQRLLARSYPHPWLSVSSLLYYRFLLPFTKSSEITKIPCTIERQKLVKEMNIVLNIEGKMSQKEYLRHLDYLPSLQQGYMWPVTNYYVTTHTVFQISLWKLEYMAC